MRAAGKSRDCGRAGNGQRNENAKGKEKGKGHRQVLRQRGKLFSQRAARGEIEGGTDGRKFQCVWQEEEEQQRKRRRADVCG